MTSFGLAIISNVVVASCIAAYAYCVGLRSCRSATAHLLWLAVFIKLVTPPLFTIPLPLHASWYDRIVTSSKNALPIIKTRIATNSFPSTDNHFAALSSTNDTTFERNSLSLEAYSTTYRIHWPALVAWMLATTWITVALLLLVQGLARFARFANLLREQAEPSEQGALQVRQLLEGRGRSQFPQVLKVPVDIAPMLFGIGSWTAIVCPQRLWDALGIEQRRAFLAHEVAHYLRRDHWVRWLEWIVSSIYWWLPLTYLARNQLERNEEMACDQWAIRKLNIKRRDYAETLLQVVEFLEASRVASPRLASRMQSTDLLETRVQLILKKPQTAPQRSYTRYLSFGFAALLLLAHPCPYRHSLAHSRGSSAPHTEAVRPASTLEAPVAIPDRKNQVEERGLPTVPAGWWSNQPERSWADIALTSSGARLSADAGAGVRIKLADGHKLEFPIEHLTGCVEILGTGRIVIADSAGALRLWDLKDGTAVSLIGNHAAEITSVAFHEVAGLVASDAQGSVIRWDHRSGSTIETWTTQEGPIQAIRWSRSGDTLAVLLGNWSHISPMRQLVILDARNFEIQDLQFLPTETAIVWEDTAHGWLSADWQGRINLLSGEPITVISKHDVSAFVLSQNAIYPIFPLDVSKRLQSAAYLLSDENLQ